jgi:endo-1,4-beta-mannosidase
MMPTLGEAELMLAASRAVEGGLRRIRNRCDGMARFRLGFNYWPRSSAMQMWRRFDRAEVASDFARAAEFGFDCVRFFLTWDAFAPAPGTIDPAMLERLRLIADCAADAGLMIMPTLFCGHMSGVNWLPSWSLDPLAASTRFRTITERGESDRAAADFYARPELLDAQQLFARRAADTLRGHPALWAWDLGNEFSNLREPRDAADAAAWSAQLSRTLIDASGAAVTAGTHGEDLTQDRNLRLSSLCEPFAFATMHGYSVYSDFARDRLDTGVVPFLCDVARSFSRKPVLFSEFGNPATPLDPQPGDPPLPFATLNEEEMSTYARTVLERLHARGALGAMWWCWTDYAPGLAAEPPFDRAPHELRFGLLRSDGTAKPVAHALAAFAREKREVIADTAAMPLDEAAYYAALPASTGRAYARYCEEFS